LNPGEATLWHLGHCGWAIKTSDHVLVFDYQPERFTPANPGLANGRLSAHELREHDVWIFVTHGHGDHFDPAIFALADQLPRVHYVYGFNPSEVRGAGPYSGPEYTAMPPRSDRSWGDLRVVTIESNDAGVGFLVTVDGVSVYHAGDHAGWRDGQREGFTGEVDRLQALDLAVDLAFLNVTGCHTRGQCPLEDGTQYTVDHLKPAAWLPTHAGGQEHLYREFADRARTRGAAVPSACPWYRGEVYRYQNGSIVLP